MKFITVADRTGIVETELFASQYPRSARAFFR
jgi:hypothetical protein